MGPARARRPGRFDPTAVAGLPQPARRWLCHAIAPGASLARTVLLEMEGRFRLGRWLTLRSVQVLSPPAGSGLGCPDRQGAALVPRLRPLAMAWRLAGRVPVVHAEGPDLDRSAAGRLPGEAVWVPARLSRPGRSELAAWAGPGRSHGGVDIRGHAVVTDLGIADGGGLRSVTIRPWGNPAGEPWGEYPFGGTGGGRGGVRGDHDPDADAGMVVFRHGAGGAGAFFELRITNAHFL